MGSESVENTAPTPSQLINLPEGTVTIAGEQFALREWVEREWRYYLSLIERYGKPALEREMTELANNPPQKTPKARAAEGRMKSNAKRYEACLKRMEEDPFKWTEKDDEELDKHTDRLERSTEVYEEYEVEFLKVFRAYTDRVVEINDALEQATEQCYVRMVFYLRWHSQPEDERPILNSDDYLEAESAWVDGLEGADFDAAERLCGRGQRAFLARVSRRVEGTLNPTPGMSGASTSPR